MAVLWADTRSDSALLPKAIDAFGIAVGGVALVSGLGYVSGTLVLPIAIRLTITLGCGVFAALGMQIVRHEGAQPARAHPLLGSVVAVGRRS